MKNSIQSKVFTFAHKIKKHFKTWSNALKFAWKKLKIQARLSGSIQYFEFRKKSGEIRPAWGTTNSSFFNYENKGKSSGCWYIIKYYDLQKNGWRCFDVRRLIKF